MSLIEDVRHGLRDLDKSRHALKRFALVIAVALLIVGALSFFLGAHAVRALFLVGVAGLFIVLSVCSPSILKPLHFVWMAFALTLGWIVSRVLLALLFYLVFTPMGLVMRLMGKDTLNRRIDPNIPSYWIAKPERERTPARYKRQY